MTPSLIALAALAALFLWLFTPHRRRRKPTPEDDVTTPVDQGELSAAERELEEDPGARPLRGDGDSRRSFIPYAAPAWGPPDSP